MVGVDGWLLVDVGWWQVAGGWQVASANDHGPGPWPMLPMLEPSQGQCKNMAFRIPNLLGYSL